MTKTTNETLIMHAECMAEEAKKDAVSGHVVAGMIFALVARIRQQDAEIERLQTACNQSRLAFAGIVSVQSAIDALDSIDRPVLKGSERKFHLGERVTKIKGSQWTGRVVGFYSTELTPIGYAVESETERGSVQIYPEAALKGGKA